MRALLAAALFCFAPSSLVYADVLSYPAAGSIAPNTTLTAAASGQVTGYFYGSDAGGTDYVRLLDLTSGYLSPFLLDNHASLPGSMVAFGSVSAGDTLVFQVVNAEVENNKDGTDFTHQGDPFDPNAQSNGYLMASDPAYSVDAYNHAYVTAFSGSSRLGIPPGVYLGMEDLPFGAADLDYNDVEFVFTNVSASSVTPEPGSLFLVATGSLGLLTIGTKRWKGANGLRAF